MNVGHNGEKRALIELQLDIFLLYLIYICEVIDKIYGISIY